MSYLPDVLERVIRAGVGTEELLAAAVWASSREQSLRDHLAEALGWAGTVRCFRVLQGRCHQVECEAGEGGTIIETAWSEVVALQRSGELQGGRSCQCLGLAPQYPSEVHGRSIGATHSRRSRNALTGLCGSLVGILEEEAGRLGDEGGAALGLSWLDTHPGSCTLGAGEDELRTALRELAARLLGRGELGGGWEVVHGRWLAIPDLRSARAVVGGGVVAELGAVSVCVRAGAGVGGLGGRDRQGVALEVALSSEELRLTHELAKQMRLPEAVEAARAAHRELMA